MKRRLRLTYLLVTLLILSTGCARSTNNPSEGDSDRTISVEMRDDFRFDPSVIDVSPGEAVEFQVANKGAMVHEFLVGDEDKQREFEKGMTGDGHMEHSEGNPGVSVKPGEEKSFVFVFPKRPRNLLFGCHEPGHYSAGMRGTFRFGNSRSVST